MIVNYELQPLESSKYSKRSFNLNQITQCPICKKNISPVFLHGVYKQALESAKIECHFLCNGCEHTFIGSYLANQDKSGFYSTGDIVAVEPSHYVKQDFDNSIENLSPQFVKIYNQALAAESTSLDEIAGLGYRKSLEFLIKDFAIHLQPSDEAKIQESWFKSVIDTYINDPTIKILVERSSWIGNDEAHYLRKQTNRDVNDMKKFIQAIVYYVGMYLITEDAESMDSMK